MQRLLRVQHDASEEIAVELSKVVCFLLLHCCMGKVRLVEEVTQQQLPKPGILLLKPGMIPPR